MKILGIETSCDETAISVVEITDKDGVKVLSNIVSSQIKLHAKYGGVVPSLASREHLKNIRGVFELALKKAFGTKNYKQNTANFPIDLIAVTRGPGLGPALLIGLTFAKTIAWIYKKPVIGVNHMEGHIYSNWLSKRKMTDIFPALNLIVSGGHTELVLMKKHGSYEIIGETLDDAVGEAFDKVARLLGLGYPGGPAISKIAEKGNPNKYPLPKPMENSKDYNFSYSGLKTAVLYLLRDLNPPAGGKKPNLQTKADIASSFQKSAIDVLVQKTMRATEELKVKSIMLSGGVSANSLLRSDLNKASAELGVKYFQPKLEYTGDNATMIAVAGYFSAKGGSASGGNRKKKTDYKSVKMDANLGFR